MNGGTWPDRPDRNEFAALKSLTGRLMAGGTVGGSASPIGCFLDIVASRNPGGDRWGEAKCAQDALNPHARTPNADLAQRVEELPRTRPAEIAIVLEWLRESSNEPYGNGSQVRASELVLGELCLYSRRAARRLRSWGVLPGHSDDWVGVEWAADAAFRIRSGCDCGDGHSCRHPEIHQISSWLDPRTHQRKGESGPFLLGNWLERACCGHSPAFKPVGTSSQGLIFAVEPDLDEGHAAIRLCSNEECPDHREPVTMGRACPRCLQEPAGAIRLRRKVVNTRSWVRRRFVRCCGGGRPDDEHFLERTEKCCPECDWRPDHESPAYADCRECFVRVRWDDAVCINGHAVPKARGVKRAWVYNPPLPDRLVDPLDPRSTPSSAIEYSGGQAPLRSIGLSHDASELLIRLRHESRRPVDTFVQRFALVSPSWRRARGLIGPPSAALRAMALDALERLCVRVHNADEEALLRGELARIFSAWDKEVF